MTLVTPKACFRIPCIFQGNDKVLFMRNAGTLTLLLNQRRSPSLGGDDEIALLCLLTVERY